jgi:hypothetical protein
MPVVQCVTDADCNDQDYCNGHELCVNAECYPGTPVDCTPGSTLLQGDYTILTSLDVQALKGVQTITGNLVVNGPALTSLVGLESLLTIGGDLVIQNNPKLKKLSGSALSNLLTVGGQILISNNASLVDINLPSLTRAGALIVFDNPVLAHIDGTNALVTLDGDLEVLTNAALLSIDGLLSLATAGGINIRDNAALTSMAGLTSLRDVVTDVQVYSNPLDHFQLDALTGVGGALLLSDPYEDVPGNLPTLTISLAALKSVGTGVVIAAYPALTSLNLGSLAQSPYTIRVKGNAKLGALTLPVLTSAGGLEVGNCPMLGSLGLPRLTQLVIDKRGNLNSPLVPDGSLNLYGLALTSLALPEVTKLDGNLSVDGSLPPFDSTLQSISAPKLAQVGGGLYVIGFSSLTGVSLGALTGVSGAVYVQDNDVLATLALGKLASVGGDLYLSRNCLLSSVDAGTFGTAALTVTGSYVSIHDNTGLDQTLDVDPLYTRLTTNGFQGQAQTTPNGQSSVCPSVPLPQGGNGGFGGG